MTQWLASVSSDRGSIAVWAGFIGAPLLWGVHLQLGYMLVPWLCTTQKYWVAHLVTVLFLIAGGVCIWLCWREWRRVGGGMPSSHEPPIDGRTRFAALVGMWSSALFTMVIFAGHLPTFFLSPCWD
jgi:hypothetical protein